MGTEGIGLPRWEGSSTCQTRNGQLEFSNLHTMAGPSVRIYVGHVGQSVLAQYLYGTLRRWVY